MLKSMMAWEKTQTIGLLKAEKARAEVLVDLYEKLEKALRENAPAYKIDGLEWAIHSWTVKSVEGPYLYEGIRADFAQFAGDSPSESFDDLTSRLMV
jgi:hypothetical protein